jgi:uncharacterized RDD family membrane protein YckC
MSDRWKYIKCFLMGRSDADSGVYYARINHRMFAACVDMLIMILAVQPVLDFVFAAIYPKPEINQQYLQGLLSIAFTSDQDLEALTSYMQDTGLLAWITTSIIIQILILGIGTLYFWMYYGATPGKLLLGLRIRSANDFAPINRSQALLRLISYPLSAICLMLGFFSISWDKRRQGWHDKIAGTVVVFKSTLQAADPSDYPAP